MRISAVDSQKFGAFTAVADHQHMFTAVHVDSNHHMRAVDNSRWRGPSTMASMYKLVTHPAAGSTSL